MKRYDVAALNAGLVLIALAVLALSIAYQTVDWRVVSIAGPIGLVVIGLLGLILSRKA